MKICNVKSIIFLPLSLFCQKSHQKKKSNSQVHYLRSDGVCIDEQKYKFCVSVRWRVKDKSMVLIFLNKAYDFRIKY